MNWKSLGRLLVCLVLVCVILVNCSPIRAKAVEPVTMVMVSAATVIASVMIGIGVMMGQNREAFDQVVQMVQGSNALKDFIQQDATKGDVIPLYRSPGTGGVGSGALSLLVAGALIEAIRQALFREEILTESVSYDSFALSDGVVIPAPADLDFSAYPNIIIYSCNDDNSLGKYYRIKASGRDFTHVYESNYDCIYFGSTYIKVFQGRFVDDSWDSISQVSNQNNKRALQLGGYYNLVWSSHDIFSSDGSVFYHASSPISSVGTSQDLTLGEIAPQEQEISEGYSDWVAGSQWDANNSQWWPVAVAPTYDETLNFSQEQVQKGESTITDADLEDSSEPEQNPDSDQVTASGLKGWLDGIKDRITLLLQPISIKVSDIYDSVSSGLSSIGNSIAALPQAITAPIIDALEYIFVPREDFVSDKVSELRKEFAFADTLITGGQMIGDAFNGFDTSPPIIYIDLGATRGDYDIGGKVPFIDLTWYEEYKPTVDMLLSSFLWVVFIWKLFQKAPGIISGMPGDFVMEGLQSVGFDMYSFGRKESYERLRQTNRRKIR